MADNLLTEYRKIFSFFYKFLVLVLVCVIVALCIVFPFWKLAVSFPSLYTIVLVLGFVAVLLVCLFAFLKKTFEGKSKEEKKQIYRKMFFVITQAVVLLFAVIFFVVFVIKGSRILGFISLILGIFCYGVLSFAKSKKV